MKSENLQVCPLHLPILVFLFWTPAGNCSLNCLCKCKGNQLDPVFHNFIDAAYLCCSSLRPPLLYINFLTLLISLETHD